MKSKGENERYKHLDAEFQRIARRDKKAFFTDQCKEIEENNRMGKTRDLFKKIRDTKGTFHAKMGSIKDRNGVDLTEAEDIQKRWQEYTEELYKKDLHDPDNHKGVITHLEPDILECEVKWALGSITVNKASGGDGIPVELFQILCHIQIFETPRTSAFQVSLSCTISQSWLRLLSIESVMSSNYLILCFPLLLLPSVFPRIRVFSNELAHPFRWPKYWSFSFSISPSNEYSGLISFRIDRFDLLEEL